MEKKNVITNQPRQGGKTTAMIIFAIGNETQKIIEFKKANQETVDNYLKSLSNPLQSMGMYGVESAQNLWQEKRLSSIFKHLDEIQKILEKEENGT